MALTYIYLTQPLAQAQASSPGGGALPGKIYTANSAGVITAVAPGDALNLQPIAGASLQLMCATGATTDRPASTVATALTGALNNGGPFPAIGLPFWDTTLSKVAFFVGTQRSSTGWLDQAGNAV